MAQSQHAARGETERVYVAMVRTVRKVHIIAATRSSLKRARKLEL